MMWVVAGLNFNYVPYVGLISLMLNKAGSHFYKVVMYNSFFFTKLSDVPPRVAVCEQMPHGGDLTPVKCPSNAQGNG